MDRVFYRAFLCLIHDSERVSLVASVAIWPAKAFWPSKQRQLAEASPIARAFVGRCHSCSGRFVLLIKCCTQNVVQPVPDIDHGWNDMATANSEPAFA